jgi:sirohydrochlorin ferrochelatase
MFDRRVALLLIAHGSRRAEANADLEFVAAALRDRGRYPIVQVSFLELAEPDIAAGGAMCVEAGATDVILLPYFLSPGKHVAEDLTAARDALGMRFPGVRFALAEPLGRHPLLLDVLEQRARDAESAHRRQSPSRRAPEKRVISKGRQRPPKAAKGRQRPPTGGL